MRSYFSKKIFGLFFSCLLLLSAAAWGDVGGTLIPFYGYPTPAAIQPLLDAKAAHPNVPMRVILDPASGPGQTLDPVYATAIQTLRAAGIQTAGYVYTNYNARPIGNVKTTFRLA